MEKGEELEQMERGFSRIERMEHGFSRIYTDLHGSIIFINVKKRQKIIGESYGKQV